MRQLLYTVALLLATSIIFTSCRNDEVVAQSVTLTGCDADTPLIIGNTRRLSAAVYPEDAINQDITWTASDPAVATVVNGLALALTAGTTTITAATNDVAVYATCVVTVIIDPVLDPAGVVIAGTRWATRNVDMPGTFAESPQSAGRFFQWGTLGGVTYHWAGIETVTIPGWNNHSRHRVAWTAANDPCPPGWRVPTEAELNALRNQPSTWQTNWNGTGINGRLYGTAPHQVFLPAAGWRFFNTGVLEHSGTRGYYWSNTQHGTENAMSLWFISDDTSVDSFIRARAYGASIRCVAE